LAENATNQAAGPCPSPKLSGSPPEKLGQAFSFLTPTAKALGQATAFYRSGATPGQSAAAIASD